MMMTSPFKEEDGNGGGQSEIKGLVRGALPCTTAGKPPIDARQNAGGRPAWLLPDGRIGFRITCRRSNLANRPISRKPERPTRRVEPSPEHSILLWWKIFALWLNEWFWEKSAETKQEEWTKTMSKPKTISKLRLFRA